MNDDPLHFLAAQQRYAPTALYFQDADSIEYTRVDAPCIHRRIDAILTLILEMDTREPVGFKVKGFKYFYMRIRNKCEGELGQEFIDLTRVLSEAFSMLGDSIFEQSRKKERMAYEEAIDIATRDAVTIRNPIGLAC